MRAWKLRHLAVALALMACGQDEPAGPVLPPVDPPTDESSALVLSAPIPRSALGENAPGTVVFVSAKPAAFPRGARALLGLASGAASSTVPLAGGGFDATALVAGAGDEIVVTVVDSAGARIRETATARAPARPKVLRTSPAMQRTDVPLNVVIEVAFSAPMDSASVAAALQLRQGDALVTGAVVFRDADRTTATFVPAAALEQGREYVIDLDGAARDLLGRALESGVEVTFTTTAVPDQVTVRDIRIERAGTVVLRPGETVELTARVCVRLSDPCEEVVAPITWISSAGVVSLAPVGGSALPARAVVTAVSSGSTAVIAISGTDRGEMPVRVLSPAPASLAANEIVFSYTHLWAIRADGTGLRQLTTGLCCQRAPSVAADGRIVFLGYPSSGSSLSIRGVDGSVRSHPLPPPSQSSWYPYCPAWSPDMRYIAYLEAESSSPELVGIIRVVHADSTAIEAATFASRDMTCPSWTPRGELVAARGSVRDGASLQVLTLDGNETTRASGAFLPGQLSPDGSAVVTLTYDLQRSLSWVERWSMVGGSVTRLYPRGLNWPGYEDTPPQWSPDGALIAYGSYAYGIILIDASNGEPQWLGDTWGSDYDMGFWPFGDDPTFVPPGVSFTR